MNFIFFFTDFVRVFYQVVAFIDHKRYPLRSTVQTERFREEDSVAWELLIR